VEQLASGLQGASRIVGPSLSDRVPAGWEQGGYFADMHPGLYNAWSTSVAGRYTHLAHSSATERRMDRAA
jgi:hypothetical protein